MNIVDAVEFNARANPHAAALIEPDRAISHAELAEMVLRAAHAFTRNGLAAGDRVAIRLPNWRGCGPKWRRPEPNPPLSDSI